MLKDIKRIILEMKKVLLIGAAGTIGTSLRKYLDNQYHFRCLDIRPVKQEADAVTADIKDFESLLHAMAGVEAVIYLATNPDRNQSWEKVYAHGIAGTYNVFEAARRAGVKKVIYAIPPLCWAGGKCSRENGLHLTCRSLQLACMGLEKPSASYCQSITLKPTIYRLSACGLVPSLITHLIHEVFKMISCEPGAARKIWHSWFPVVWRQKTLVFRFFMGYLITSAAHGISIMPGNW